MIVFEPEYRSEDALRGIEDFSHLWLIWQFSQAVREGWSPTVRPPRLGGNTRMGVFATRSPFRPNNLGLSCVRLLEVKHTQQYGTVLIVGGADLLDGVRLNGEHNGVLTVTKPDLQGRSACDLPMFNKGVKKVSESRLWIDAILNDTEPFVKPFEAYTVSRIIDGIYRSAQTGELVKL